jgi:hypothetical protein
MDFYARAHLLLATLNYLGLESKVKEFVDVLNVMEKELLKVIIYAEMNRMSDSKYNNYVKKFVNEDQIDFMIKELKELLKAYQTVNDQESIKVLERLFIQLLGHFNVIIF